ncbi:MAG: hypothetical protein R2784_10540 [Saprospiraceae bacterium]
MHNRFFTATSNGNGFFVQWIDTSGTPGLSFADGTALFGVSAASPDQQAILHPLRSPIMKFLN